MRNKGRFVFDDRPAKKEELERLITLNKIYEPYIKEIILNIKSQYSFKINRIIDIGAGTGHTTLLLKKIFPKAEVTYFDYSIELLNYAKKIATENKLEIIFKCGDISSYEFKYKYDLVFSRFALKHFYNPKHAIKIMTDILSNKGIICLIDKDVYSNIWYPNFPLYNTKFMKALNKYNKQPNRGGDSAIGRKIKYFLTSNNITIINESIIYFNLSDKNKPEIEDYKNIYIQVYENLIPELVNNNLINYIEARSDIEKLRKFINNPKYTAIIIDFVVWGQKNE